MTQETSMKSTPRVTPYWLSLRYFLWDLNFLDGLESLSVFDNLAFFDGGGGEGVVLRFLEVEVNEEGSVGFASSWSWSWS